MLPEEEDCRFREGPLERGMADFRARGPVAFACGCFGTLHQAAVGDTILDAGEPSDVMALIHQHEAQDLADPRHRLEQGYGLGIGLLGRFDDVSLQGAEELGVVGDQREGHLHAFLDRRIGAPLRDASAVGFVGQLFPDLGQVILAMRILDVP